jgi:hypothetical protein
VARAPMSRSGTWSDPWSCRQMEAICAMVRDGHRLEFSKLFNPGTHRNEVIVISGAAELLRCGKS